MHTQIWKHVLPFLFLFFSFCVRQCLFLSSNSISFWKKVIWITSDNWSKEVEGWMWRLCAVMLKRHYKRPFIVFLVSGKENVKGEGRKWKGKPPTSLRKSLPWGMSRISGARSFPTFDRDYDWFLHCLFACLFVFFFLDWLIGYAWNMTCHWLRKEKCHRYHISERRNSVSEKVLPLLKIAL